MRTAAILGPTDGREDGPLVRASTRTPPGAEYPTGCPWRPGEERRLAYTTTLPPWLERVEEAAWPA